MRNKWTGDKSYWKGLVIEVCKKVNGGYVFAAGNFIIKGEYSVFWNKFLKSEKGYFEPGDQSDLYN